jgi:alanine racemase
MQFHKVEYLAVAYADEGVELRKAGISLPVMVMNADEATFDTLVTYDLEPEIYSFPIYHAFDQYLNSRASNSFLFTSNSIQA